jgi:hypothetical protein
MLSMARIAMNWGKGHCPRGRRRPGLTQGGGNINMLMASDKTNSAGRAVGKRQARVLVQGNKKTPPVYD